MFVLTLAVQTPVPLFIPKPAWNPAPPGSNSLILVGQTMSKGQTLASSNGETGRTVRTALEMLGIAGDVRILCTEALPINTNLAEFVHETHASTSHRCLCRIGSCCTPTHCPHPTCGNDGCMCRWRALSCSMAVSLAALDALELPRGGKVFHLEFGLDAADGGVVAADLLRTACPPGMTLPIHTVAKQVNHPSASQYVTTRAQHSAICNSIWNGFKDVADFFNVDMPSKPVFFEALQAVNPYFDPMRVVARRAESLGFARGLIKEVMLSTLSRVRRCLALEPEDAVDVRLLYIQLIFQWAVREEFRERFPDERPATLNVRAPAAAEPDTHIKIDEVLTLKRAPPDMEGDKTSVKRAAISGTAKCAPPKHELPPLPAKWTRKEIARLGQRAYHYADKVLSSPYNPAVAHLLEREVVLPGRGLRYSVKRRFEKEVESVAQCLRDDQGGLEKLIARELEKPPNEQQQSVLQQWRGQLRDLHKNWLARLWQDFAQGKLLAELPLDRWTVAQTEESLPSLLPATGVFSGWVFRRKGRKSFNKSPRFPFSPRPPKTTGFVLLPVLAIASLLIKGTTQFKDNAMQLLQSRGSSWGACQTVPSGQAAMVQQEEQGQQGLVRPHFQVRPWRLGPWHRDRRGHFHRAVHCVRALRI